MRVHVKDIASGLFFALVGLFYFWVAWTGLPVGSALQMGPGYFPIVLSSILMLFGVFIAGRGFLTAPDSGFGRMPWRAIIMLSVATLVFALAFNKLGMLPGVFVLTFLASLASPENSIGKAAIVGVVVSLFCTIVFGYGIRLPIPVIGPLFGF